MACNHRRAGGAWQRTLGSTSKYGCVRRVQGLDTQDDVMAPKVVEALLGTRFQGRDFLRAPLVRAAVMMRHHGRRVPQLWHAASHVRSWPVAQTRRAGRHRW